MFPAAVPSQCDRLLFFHYFLSKRSLREIQRIEFYCVWAESFIQGDRMPAGVVMKDPCFHFSSNMQVYIVLANSFSFRCLKSVLYIESADQFFLISSRKLTSLFPSFTLFCMRLKLFIAEKCVKQNTALLTSTVQIYCH